ncbi:MAG TPA: orotate phosphoribosyltransferase [Candidatus Eisenbacteria bacterium]|nr:orotate phosphoribosyltransferase [Candidatus Eisenbacteria bacterium]
MIKSSIKIANLLLDIEAVTFSFTKPYLYTFVSGIRGPIYCDNRRLISYPHKRKIVVDEVVKVSKNLKFDIIGGVSTAGIPWAALLAERLHKPMIYIRPEPKRYGEKRQIEGDMEKGKTVLVIDDLVSTGKSAISVIDVIRRNGGKVTDCVSIFTYGLETARKNFNKIKCTLHPLLSLSDLIEVALDRKYISKEEREELLKWQKDPIKYWKQS